MGATALSQRPSRLFAPGDGHASWPARCFCSDLWVCPLRCCLKRNGCPFLLPFSPMGFYPAPSLHRQLSIWRPPYQRLHISGPSKLAIDFAQNSFFSAQTFASLNAPTLRESHSQMLRSHPSLLHPLFFLIACLFLTRCATRGRNAIKSSKSSFTIGIVALSEKRKVSHRMSLHMAFLS